MAVNKVHVFEPMRDLINPQEPQDISDAEATLGFERLLIEGLGDLDKDQTNPFPIPVVVKILSSSDILLKTFDFDGSIIYSHKRRGNSKSYPVKEWHPVDAPVSDAADFLSRYANRTHPESAFAHTIIPCSFKHSKANFG